MSADIRLGDYATSPLYNIKAVVQATKISPSTLRAWERRYNISQPQRSASGYRLYSERDVAVINWLKMQVDAGMAISQAVSWLESLSEEAGGYEQSVLPGSTNLTVPDSPPAAPQNRGVQDLANLQHDLLNALVNRDERAAEQAIAEAFSLYSVEQAGEALFAPVLVEIGDRWHRGEIGVTTEHYASNYLIQRLAALLRTVSNNAHGPLVWVGCAPHEDHQIGALLLAIYAKRAGYRVDYLGQNVPLGDIVAEIERRQPDLVVFSASTADSARQLEDLTRFSDSLDAAGTRLGYGGRAFNQWPELRDGMPGVFLGDTALDAVETIGQLLNRNPSDNSR